MLVVLCCFNDTPTTEIYTYLHTLSLHDALPISPARLYLLAQARSLYAPRDRRRGLQGGQDPAGDGRAPVGAVGSLGQISREYVRHPRRDSEHRGRRPARLRGRRMDGAQADELPRARPDLPSGDQVVPRPAAAHLREWLLSPQ